MTMPTEPTTVPVSQTVPVVPSNSLSPEVAALVQQAAAAASAEANSRAEAAERVAEELKAQFKETSSQLSGLTDAEKERQAKAQADADAEAVKAREAEEEKLDVKALLEKREAEFNQRLEDFQRQAEEKQALMQMEVKFQQLAAYTQGQIADHKDEILPELYDYINGNTPEEVDASIQLAMQKSQGIAAAAKAARGGRGPGAGQVPGVSTNTGPTSLGSTPELPGDDNSEEGILRQLANDNPNAMANYAKLREKMNIGRSGTGLFG